MSPRRRTSTQPRGHHANRKTWSAARSLVPASGDLADLVAAVATERCRAITLLDYDLPADAPSGLWLQMTDVDYIVSARSLTADHRRVVICHELAHMLLDHRPRDGQVDTSLIAPSISPDVAARYFTRHGYEDRDEADAESLATVLAADLAERAFAAAAALAADNVSGRLR